MLTPPEIAVTPPTAEVIMSALVETITVNNSTKPPHT
jgi:hypothetical protein